MTTALTRPVKRKVRTAHGKQLTVTLTPDGVEFREPYARKSFLLPYGAAHLKAVDLDRAAKQTAKGRKKKVTRSLLR
jgi:hypothetical protein